MNTENLKIATQKVIEVKPYYEVLDKFAEQKFNERYDRKKANGPIWYNGFEVIDENTIKVTYQFGGGDMEMDDSFNVTI